MKLIDSNLNILALAFGQHGASVAYFEKGNLKYVFEEERFNRIKAWKDNENNLIRYPLRCLQTLIHLGVDFNTIDYFTGWQPYKDINHVLGATIFYNFPEEKYIQQEHHEVHTATAYYPSGFKDDTLAIAIDASGNEYSARYFLGQQGDLINIESIKLDRKSLGHYYIALTEFLGFKRHKDEGKIVGMSGHGDFVPNLYNVWNNIIKIEDLQTDFCDHPDLPGGSIYRDMHANFFNLYGSMYYKNSFFLNRIANTGQYIFEEKVLEIINNLHKRYPNIKNIALSGGIFANVKLNKRINDLDWVKNVFVAPSMGDEGLSFGAMLLTLKQLYPSFKPFKLENMFFGREYNKEEINTAANNILGNYNYIPLNIDFIASLLHNKKILGLFQGGFEHGPRALGNRSIICDATHPETYDILNNKLKRNDFMPFAPAVLEEDANILFKINKSSHTAEFMTMLYDTQDEWKDKLPTVTHPIDKTARIQIVTEQSNPLFYQILKTYKEKSGVGCLVNTSFNIHNEPIVECPENAFEHLKTGIIDYLVTPYGIYSKI
jgi:carbamoyltransferase